MLLNEVLDIYKLLDQPGRPADTVIQLLRNSGSPDIRISKKTIKEKKGQTDFIKIIVPGKSGFSAGEKSPTLGIIGRLGGVGARPETVGFVSDGDGALTALSVALKLARMHKAGDVFESDIIIATHICTNAPTMPHEPVAFMGSPVDLATMNTHEVDKTMDAIISIDTSRGNRIINTNGFAITPTVKEGWILKVSDDLLRIMEYTTGTLPAVVPITMQDITPYGNGVYHFNSLMQPAVATKSPVVGVAITSELPVPGCWTGASNAHQIDMTGRFVIEVAQGYGKGNVSLFDTKEYGILKKKYGSMNVLSKK